MVLKKDNRIKIKIYPQIRDKLKEIMEREGLMTYNQVIVFLIETYYKYKRLKRLMEVEV